MAEVYKVRCEWDIGLEEIVFLTYEGAWEAATRGIEEMGENVDECQAHGLVGVDTWEIV